VRHDLGFLLFRAVEATKRALSEGEAASFVFEHGGIRIDEPVTRAAFESWIEEELEAIRSCVDRLLRSQRIRPEHVDCVFLTGGSSLVPAVRAIFASRFGEEKIRSGGELTSVASGLALRCGELG